MEWGKFFYVIGAILMVGILVWTIRSSPQMFSRENISRSFTAMGILALILIGAVALMVLFLRSS